MFIFNVYTNLNGFFLIFALTLSFSRVLSGCCYNYDLCFALSDEKEDCQYICCVQANSQWLNLCPVF